MKILTVGVSKAGRTVQVWKRFLLAPPKWFIRRRRPEERN